MIGRILAVGAVVLCYAVPVIGLIAAIAAAWTFAPLLWDMAHYDPSGREYD